MDAKICSAAAMGLSGTILIVYEAFMQKKGVQKRKAYVLTQAVILETVVKMIEALEGE